MNFKKYCSEAFMPVSYGGGVQNLNDINKLLNVGCEKISLNSKAMITNLLKILLKCLAEAV